MRRCVVVVLVAVCLQARAAAAQDGYPAVLFQYLSGDADAALG